MKLSSVHRAVSAGIAAAACVAAQAATPRYHVVDLGLATTPTGINSAGEVSGSDSAGAAAVYRDGAWSPLKTWVKQGGRGGRTTGINDKGTVSGYLDTYPFRAVIWKASGERVIIAPVDGVAENQTQANAVAADGTVVGDELSATGFPSSVAFVWKAGVGTSLGVPPGGQTSDARAINAAGQVAGRAVFAGGSDAHAFVLAAGAWRDLGTLGGPSSVANGLDAQGRAVGCADTDARGDGHAFLHDGTTMIDLGTAGGVSSCAVAIDPAGTIVGGLMDEKKQSHAFVYADGRMQKVGPLVDNPGDWTFWEALGISDDGRIVGLGWTGTSEHVFMLVPLAPQSSAPASPAR